MAGFRLIDVAKPFLPILPEVESPLERVPFDEKMVYTIFTALIYLFAEFPLTGISKDFQTATVNDPIYFLRGVFAASPKTLLEFGIFPIISSALLLQLLAGLKIIKVNFKIQKDRELFQTLTKLFAVSQYFILTNIFIFSGYYGANLSILQIALLNFQLCGAGLFITLLTEVVDKGFGFASGIMILNTAAVATNFIADTFGVSQIKIDAAGHTEAQGSLMNLIQSFRNKDTTILGGIIASFTRDYLPNFTTTVVVVLFAAIVCYLQSVRLELPVRSTRTRGVNNVYPIRLLNIGALALLFSYIVLFYVHIFSFILIQIVANNNQESIICKILGHYDNVNNLLAVPTFPLSLLTPPRSFFGGMVSQPLTFVVYTSFVVFTSICFASQWQNISGSSARDLAAEFKDQGITLTGRREQNIAKELDKIVPVASNTGAAMLALLAVTGELLGLKGKAAGIVIGIAGGFSLLELITLDYQQSGGQSALSSVLGAPNAGM
ncbi:Ssh1p NDAI_0B04900 [Naumovozyma dairenensis CBS 421]|uniref:Translocon Sec61/SecY plug domain-containing protein n=1 Tax=Naumovozyma dairenensis (strain ATCC 10597 / BCRC 20456 / CBS 421 / NBRC 0211 / NRRL Y-12639) TaxID=1071378 RepID=G0W6W3_NAUDC|nr:hypothetical protein NDAI_0B04900 [Naumovozyma dairenensis CBS 421]CCD23524.1 hypothetical protein NDAI_0B04900 [Naumovozyma dairenensis CBS 421]